MHGETLKNQVPRSLISSIPQLLRLYFVHMRSWASGLYSPNVLQSNRQQQILQVSTR